jgi:hypothetical protein
VPLAFTSTDARPAEVALTRLQAGDLSDGERAALVETVRTTLRRSTSEGARVARAMTELVIEIEELAANGASSRAVIHRVRAQARRAGLDPIEGTGSSSTMDRHRHRSVGAPIGDGTPVVVVRPGYAWRSPVGAVVVEKAVVQDRS